MRICAVIPAFNSQSTIGKVIQETQKHVDQVVVVDDGSSDQTIYVSEDAGADVIKIPQNKGKGNALREAIRYTLKNNFDAIITLDADLQHDPSEIPKFIKYQAANKCNIVVGNRLHLKDKIPRIRYGPNRVGTFLFSKLIGQTIEDSQCGFRLYDRKVMKNILILNDGFEAEADILLRAGKRKYEIGFIPVQPIYFSGPKHFSYYRPIKDTFRICIIFLMNLIWKNR